jgi:hypothetical protein
MHKQMFITTRLIKKGVSYKQESRLLGCRYLSVRRGNPMLRWNCCSML